MYTAGYCCPPRARYAMVADVGPSSVHLSVVRSIVICRKLGKIDAWYGIKGLSIADSVPHLFQVLPRGNILFSNTSVVYMLLFCSCRVYNMSSIQQNRETDFIDKVHMQTFYYKRRKGWNVSRIPSLTWSSIVESCRLCFAHRAYILLQLKITFGPMCMLTLMISLHLLLLTSCTRGHRHKLYTNHLCNMRQNFLVVLSNMIWNSVLTFHGSLV